MQEAALLDRRRAKAGASSRSDYLRSLLTNNDRPVVNLAPRLHRAITLLRGIAPRLGRDRDDVDAVTRELVEIFREALGRAFAEDDATVEMPAP